MSFVFMIGDLWSVIHGAIEGPPPIKSANDTHPPPSIPLPQKRKETGKVAISAGVARYGEGNFQKKLILKKQRSISKAKWQPLNSEVIPRSWAARNWAAVLLLLRR